MEKLFFNIHKYTVFRSTITQSALVFANVTVYINRC